VAIFSAGFPAPFDALFPSGIEIERRQLSSIRRDFGEIILCRSPTDRGESRSISIPDGRGHQTAQESQRKRWPLHQHRRFRFSAGLYAAIPDFAIGRLWFDHWLIKSAREQNLPVVDASLVAPVLHQNHDYGHVVGGKSRYGVARKRSGIFSCMAAWNTLTRWWM